jgi:arginyl-tRNA synthetase
VGRWYEEDPERQELRRQTLHQLEQGEGERAEMGRLVSRRIVRRHLKTMRRLGISYDLLTHESAILGLDFFDRASEMLKSSQAIRLEKSGKNAGCWVMPLAESEEFAGLEDPDKVCGNSASWTGTSPIGAGKMKMSGRPPSRGLPTTRLSAPHSG